MVSQQLQLQNVFFLNVGVKIAFPLHLRHFILFANKT